MAARRSPTVRIERQHTTCSLCKDPADCAVFCLVERNDVALCSRCLLDGAMVASSRPRCRRPHPEPCYCAGCVAWSRGQSFDAGAAAAGDAELSPLELETARRARGLETD